jgi:WD40 repeat protein
MNNSQKKKGSPILVFAVALAIIFIVIVMSNRRNSLVAQLNLPLNNGIANLSTYENLLSAVSNDSQINVWDWTNLSQKPRHGIVESDQAALITPDTVISVKRVNPENVVISGLDANNTRRELYLPAQPGTAYLAVNQDRTKIVLLLARSENSTTAAKYDLFEVSADSGKVQSILTVESESSSAGHLAVSNDGNRIVVTGDKKDHGWMFVADLKEKRLVWQKEMPDFKKIFKAAFSANGEIIYARGTDSTLLEINAGSGDEIRRLLPTEENKSTYKTQYVQAVVVSPDGNYVAGAFITSVYIWDTKTGKKSGPLGGGHKVQSSIAISPDSSLLATSDMRQGGKINIQRIPH